MHLVVSATALALVGVWLSPTRAVAANVLYATAASQGRIDGFRLEANGAFGDGRPDVQAATDRNPRRVLVVGCTLYVAEDDRVEAFAIGRQGGLDRLGRTAVDPDAGTTDLVASPDGRMLYVAERGFDRVVAYPLGPAGRPAAVACTCRDDTDCNGSPCTAGRCLPEARPCALESPTNACADGRECVLDYTSCALGRFGIRYQDLAAHGSLLYAAGSGLGTGIDAFQVDGAGDLPTRADACDPPTGDDRPPLTRPTWCRRRLNSPRLAVDERGILYAHDRPRGKIFGFRELTPPTLVDASDSSLPCTEETESCACSNKRAAQQRADAKTAAVAAYEDLLIENETLFGSEFQRGRIDAYRLVPDASRFIRRHPRRSGEDVRMSPVGMTLRTDPVAGGDATLYLAGGELDRVRAYRLRRRGSGAFGGFTFIDQTEEQEGSFPNDVALAVTPESCQ
jgi:hypothetical protein